MARITRTGEVLLAVWIVAALSSCSSAQDGFSVTNGLQVEILADGVITASEYERAVLATQECVEQVGWKTDDLELGIDGFTLSFAVVWTTDKDALREAQLSFEADEAFTRCAGDYLDQVEVAYIESQAPTGSERVEKERGLVSCLVAAGIRDVPIGVTEEDLIDILVGHEYGQNDPPIAPWLCRERYIELFTGG